MPTSPSAPRPTSTAVVPGLRDATGTVSARVAGGRTIGGRAGSGGAVPAGARAVAGETTVGGAVGRGSVRGTSTVGWSLATSFGTEAGTPSPAASASTKAPAVGQRSSGFLAAAFSSARSIGSGTTSGAGSGSGSCTCFISTATGVSAENGTRPTSIS